MSRIDCGCVCIETGEQQNYQDGNPLPSLKEVVLKQGKYCLKIDYPLDNPYKFKFNVNKKGITRGDFIELVCKHYHKVYDEENGTSNIKEQLGIDAGCGPLLNRITTNGKYGIWGHVIGDLVLVCANVSSKNVITLGVDS